ncbi:ATP-dependent helicase HrpB [Rheinheimera riviphila]|uniref:ATP-dependent helicase HrpB n=1 Tax=Rheinheimera riviphila TaxID=1834037 RepID=A0A437R4N6_9GAMM|nr:ATP-dependent helicase HrpB [Rheinheimera riviphila]RVU41740.1 ATP-dependent helicase HrpB [Rheinheimera riviphila]
MTLPVAEICPALLQALANHHKVLLTAPPGAGKSTYLPLFLLQQPQFAGQSIIMLEPRRLAAKSIASYLAAQLGEAVGETVGYQIRFEQQYSARTRLLIVTEGVLIRKIQQDPALETTDLLIFDEFHERSLQADLALALALEVQQLNDKLKLLIMSATLAGADLSEKLAAPLLHSDGRSFPVDIRYVAPTQEDVWLQSARLARQLLSEHQGSFLVFLPGQREIERAAQYLTEQQLPPDVQVFALIGSLSLAEQQRAIAPSAPGQRKIVLATNIAETSLTIDGISLVIDAGVARQAVYQPKLGFSKLDTVQISQASATQRAGRAGRLSAGFCYRIDTAEKWARRPAFTTPDILQADLLALRLEIAGWGCQVADLFWLDPPPTTQLLAAEQCLRWLGALDPQHQLTAHGKAMLKLPTDPRLASMLLRAVRFEQEGYQGAVALAAWLAVLLEQNRRFDGTDVLAQLAQLRAGHSRQQAQQQVRQLLQALRQSADMLHASWPEQITGLLLSHAFADRIAQQRGQGYLLANGTGAILPPDDALAHSPYLVVADLRLVGNNAWVSAAATLTLDELTQEWQSQLTTIKHFAFDESSGRFLAEERQQLGALVLKRKNLSQSLSAADRSAAWVDYLNKKGLQLLEWTDAALNLQQRLALARKLQPDAGWPDLALPTLASTMHHWLEPFLATISSLAQLQKLDLYPLLWQQLNYQQQQQLNSLLPASWRSVLGTDIKLVYHAVGQAGGQKEAQIEVQVELAIRIQEMFGQSSTPTVGKGLVPVIVTLLSPGRQPLQKTADLASFWQNAYQDVKKEMKGRYPKHYWPDDPLQAMPTNKTKKAMLK